MSRYTVPPWYGEGASCNILAADNFWKDHIDKLNGDADTITRLLSERITLDAKVEALEKQVKEYMTFSTTADDNIPPTEAHDERNPTDNEVAEQFDNMYPTPPEQKDCKHNYEAYGDGKRCVNCGKVVCDTKRGSNTPPEQKAEIAIEQLNDRLDEALADKPEQKDEIPRCDEQEFYYFCRECQDYVDETHRCEQWTHLYKIPSKALKAMRDEFDKDRQIAERARDALQNRVWADYVHERDMLSIVKGGE